MAPTLQRYLVGNITRRLGEEQPQGGHADAPAPGRPSEPHPGLHGVRLITASHPDHAHDVAVTNNRVHQGVRGPVEPAVIGPVKPAKGFLARMRPACRRLDGWRNRAERKAVGELGCAARVWGPVGLAHRVRDEIASVAAVLEAALHAPQPKLIRKALC
jgi:hypothetical protein